MQGKLSKNAIILIIDKLKHTFGVKTDTELADLLGVKQNTVSSWKSRGALDYQSIIAKCDGIDLNWLFDETETDLDSRERKLQTKTTEKAVKLIDGKNDGLNDGKPKLQKRPSNANNQKDTLSVSMVGDPMSPYVADTDNMTVIPIVDISAAAGAGAYNPDHITPENSLVLPPQMVRRGVHHCIKIKGDSMAPTLLDGGYIITRLLDRAEWANIKDEHVYVITTREATTFIKRLRNRLHEFGFVVCTSDNPDKNAYRNFNLMEDEIYNVWYVEWYLSAKMPNIHATYYNQMQELRDDVDDIKEFLHRNFNKPINGD